MSREEVKEERHTETKEEAIKNMGKIVEVEKENHVETKEEAVKRVAEPLSVTIEKAKKDINTAVIMAERNYGLHSSIIMENMNYCTLSKHSASCDLTRVTDTAKDW